jgi:hypothetical protein
MPAPSRCALGLGCRLVALIITFSYLLPFALSRALGLGYSARCSDYYFIQIHKIPL